MGLLRRAAVDADVVEPAVEEVRALRVVVADEDAIDRLAGGDRADVGDLAVPLVRVERLARALALRVEVVLLLVERAQVRQVGAVGEGEVDGRVRARVAEVVVGELGEDQVRQLAVPRDLDVDVEHLVVGVAAAVGGVTARVAQRLDAGPAGVRLHRRTVHRAGGGERLHVRGGWRRRVAVGELQLGELHEAVAVVGGDVQPVVLVAAGGGDVVLLGLEALGEVLAGLRVDRGPGAAVMGALELPVLGVALGGVVGGRERVVDDGDRLGQLVADPAGRLEREPLAVDVAVVEPLGGLARRVLGAGRDRDDLVADVPGDPGRRAAGDARHLLVAVRVDLRGALPRRRGIAALERRVEVRRGTRPRRARSHQRSGQPHRQKNPSTHLSRLPTRMTTLSSDPERNPCPVGKVRLPCRSVK